MDMSSGCVQCLNRLRICDVLHPGLHSGCAPLLHNRHPESRHRFCFSVPSSQITCPNCRRFWTANGVAVNTAWTNRRPSIPLPILVHTPPALSLGKESPYNLKGCQLLAGGPDNRFPLTASLRSLLSTNPPSFQRFVACIRHSNLVSSPQFQYDVKHSASNQTSEPVDTFRKWTGQQPDAAFPTSEWTSAIQFWMTGHFENDASLNSLRALKFCVNLEIWEQHF